MFRFEYPNHLFFLLLLLLVIAVFIWYQRWRKRALNKLGEAKIVENLFPEYSKSKHKLKFILVALVKIAAVQHWLYPLLPTCPYVRYCVICVCTRDWVNKIAVNLVQKALPGRVLQ